MTTYLLAGTQGTGKTTLALSFPGKKLLIAFDHAATAGCGDDVQTFSFLPGKDDVLLNPKTVVKDGSRAKGKIKDAGKPGLWTRSVEWLRSAEFEKAVCDCDVVIFDTASYLARALMIEQSSLGDSLGREDERTDYRYAGETFTNFIWWICSEVGASADVVMTFHTDYKKRGKDAPRETNNLRVPGEAKDTISSAFSNAWFLRLRQDREGHKYELVTSDPGGTPWLRTQRGLALPPRVDWTGKDITWIMKMGSATC